MTRLLPLVGLLAAAPALLSAQELVTTPADVLGQPAPMTSQVALTFGAAVTTRFNTSDGFDHQDNELELAAEAAYEGLHFGLSLTSLYDDPTDEFEYEFALGYGDSFANGVEWDLTYAVIGLNDSAGTDEELTAAIVSAISPATDLGLAIILDPESGKSDQEVAFEHALDNRWSLVGLVGNSDRDDNLYAEVGVNYAINDDLVLEVLYEDTNDGDGLLGFTLGYEFGS